MKKTFRIFLTSFAVSMFVIWTTNELLFSVSAPKSNSIDIPQRSIALFFQNDNNVFSASNIKDIKSAKLEAIIKEQKRMTISTLIMPYLPSNLKQRTALVYLLLKMRPIFLLSMLPLKAKKYQNQSQKTRKKTILLLFKNLNHQKKKQTCRRLI